MTTVPMGLHRWTVEEYHRLAQARILGEEDRVELLNGYLVDKMTKSPRHEAVISRVERALRRLLPPGWTLRIQCAMTTADSEPEPDLAVVRIATDDYESRHPAGDDLGLIVEVSDSSLSIDRQKAAVYARAAVPNYWIVNLDQNVVEWFTDPAPSSGKYRQQRVVSGTEPLTVTIDEVTCGTITPEAILYAGPTTR